MTSKKTAQSNRTALPRAADYTKAFFKDWERLSRCGRFKMHKLKSVMLQLIANDTFLGSEWRDHQLSGNYAGHRECHIGGDFLLVYKLDESGKHGLIVFVRAGTHAELFE
jgi:mRNA interferase YafQ